MFIKAADSYQRIKGYATSFSDAVRAKGGITTSTPDDEIFSVLMEKWNVMRLISHPNCHRLAAVLGIDGKGQITVSLLAINEAGNVLPQHIQPLTSVVGGVTIELEEQLAGEEVWPNRIALKDLTKLLT